MRLALLLNAAILTLSAAAHADVPLAPRHISDDQAILANRPQFLHPPPIVPIRLKRLTLPSVSLLTLERSPEIQLPSIGFSYDVPTHPERVLREPRVAYRLLATAENVALVGYGFASYWIFAVENQADWELSWSEPSFREKLWTFQAVRMDTNSFETNTIKHPAAGVYTYLAARGSRLGVGESFAFALASSVFWEFFAEYREKVSINDLVFTPLGGPAIGEPLHQLGIFFERSEENFLTRLLATGFSPFRFLSRYFLGWVPMGASKFDKWGFPATIWHKFDLFAGLATDIDANVLRRSRGYVGAQTEIIDVPEYDKPGVIRHSLRPGTITNMRLALLVDDRGIHQSDFMSRTILGGVYEQSIESDNEHGRLGHALFAGPATAFQYVAHTFDGRVDDKLGIVNVLGGVVDASIYRGKLKARFGIDAYADFAAVNSMAIDDYIDRYGYDGFKSVLVERQYYFALGATIRPTATFSYRGIELGGQVTHDFLESIEGLDRYQERLKNDLHLSDRRITQRYWLSYAFPGNDTLQARLELERQERSGVMGNVAVSRQSLNLRGYVALRF